MRLALSSAVAPDAPPRDLLTGCGRRGLSGLELSCGPATLSDAADDRLRAVETNSIARELGLEVTGIYVRSLPVEELRPLARLSAAIEAPAVIPVESLDRALIPAAADAFAEAGGKLLIAHGGDPRSVDALRWLLASIPHNVALGMAWEIRPGVDDAHRMRDVLDATEGRMKYVRLHGGGPEADAQSGMGIGAVMARLALARFAGPIVLTPSNQQYHYAWNAWLGRAGGWGCGSKQSDPSLVTLAPSSPALGKSQ